MESRHALGSGGLSGRRDRQAVAGRPYSGGECLRSTLLLWSFGLVRRTLLRGAPSPKSGRKADREGAPPHPSEEQGTPPLSRWGLLPRLARRLAGVLCALNVLLVIALLLFVFEQLAGIPEDYYSGVP